MKFYRILVTLIVVFTLFGCASSYKVSEPTAINFISYTKQDSIALFYKYDLLQNKYAKKELKTGIKVIAVKIVNNSNKEYTFGEDLILEYSNGNKVDIVDSEIAYKSLKQGAAIYSLYLLMTPLNLYTYRTNSNGFEEETSSTPIGLVLGPGLTLINIISASSANKKFKTQLKEHNIVGKRVGKNETIIGILPIRSVSFDALKLKVISAKMAPNTN